MSNPEIRGLHKEQVKNPYYLQLSLKILIELIPTKIAIEKEKEKKLALPFLKSIMWQVDRKNTDWVNATKNIKFPENIINLDLLEQIEDLIYGNNLTIENIKHLKEQVVLLFPIVYNIKEGGLVTENFTDYLNTCNVQLLKILNSVEQDLL